MSAPVATSKDKILSWNRRNAKRLGCRELGGPSVPLVEFALARSEQCATFESLYNHVATRAGAASPRQTAFRLETAP